MCVYVPQLLFADTSFVIAVLKGTKLYLPVPIFRFPGQYSET